MTSTTPRIHAITARGLPLLAVGLAVLWVVGVNLLFARYIDNPDSLGGIVGLYGVALMALAVMTAAWLFTASRRQAAKADVMERHANGQWTGNSRMIALMISLAMIVPLFSAFVVHLHSPRLLEKSFNDLSAISDLKADQIEAWLRERRKDAESLALSPRFITRVHEYLQLGDATAGERINRRLQDLIRTNNYEIELLDVDGWVALELGGKQIHADAQTRRVLMRAFASGETQFIDLHHDANGHIHLSYLVPLLSQQPGVEDRHLGGLVLHMPVKEYLFPLIQTWPTPSPTAETVLVRRDGDDVLFLNKLRHRPGVELNQRLPLSTPRLPAAVAVMSERKQVLEGLDYRGMPVLAAVRPVSGTPWHLVAKMDRTEVMAPLKELIMWGNFVVALAIVAITATLGRLWRQQTLSHALELRAQIAEKDRVLRHFYDLSLIGIAITSPDTKQTLHVNDELCKITGYSREEMLDLLWPELIHPDHRAGDIAEYQRLLRGEIDAYARDSRLIRRNRTVIDITVNAQCVRASDGKPELTIATVQDVTARKQMELALRESETNLNHAQSIAQIGSWVLDVRRNALTWSAETYRIFGVPGGTPLTYEIFLGSVHPDDRARVDQAWKDALQGAPYDIEHRIVVNGRIKWVRELARLEFDAAGRLIGGIGTVQDITEQKEIELRLEQSEAVRRESQRIAQLGHYVLDIESGLWTSSGMLDEIFGIGDGFPRTVESWLTLVHPEQREELQSYFQNHVVRDGKPFDHEYRIVRAGDGAVRWVHGLGRLEHGPDGRPRRMLGTIQDITERRRAEERLRLAAAVFDNSHEGVMVTDADQRILLVNRAFCELKGYEEHELLGQTPAMLQSGRHDQEFYAAMWESLASTGRWQGEAWNRHRNGALSPVLVNISAIYDSTGRITHYVGVYTDISAQKSTEARLEFMAHHDSLTQLPNRLLIHSRLEHGIEVSRRENRRLALLMLDLDQFKDVNDSFGHLAGDELLQQVSKRLTGRLRGIDTVARLGGDEFAILLDNPAHQNDALRIANGIIGFLSEPWHLSNGVEVRIGVSVGISLFPEHGQNADTLLQQADAALYRAKAEGRGCARFFSDDMTQAARTRLEIESKLRRALKQNELRIYYQPQMDMASGRIIGAEALLRWHDPERGIIPPGVFIPVAEETGLISEIGAWVLAETCRQGQQWIERGLPPLTLSVNLSPHQFRFSDIGSTVRQALADSGFPAQRLELELTESALMAREGEAAAILDRLRELGVRLAIDDFGTGYSSLAYLKHFPIDVLKIDKRFIDDIPHKEDDKAITAAIIAMAHTLAYEVTAEGVETPEQLAFLRAQGCDRYQGYLVSPAVPAEEFAALLTGARQTNSRVG